MSDSEIITIVSGLPRSGTSMMMRMLEAGGMTVLQDGIRKADEDNPHGYYEFEKVKALEKDSSWLDMAKGKAVKILFHFLYQLPAEYYYKIIFMEREMTEIVASQNKMMKRRGEPKKTGDREIANLLKNEVNQIKQWLLDQPNFDVLYIQYADAITDPAEISEELNKFLNDGLTVENMRTVVDGSLYRNRNIMVK